VKEIYRLFRKHGFALAGLRSFGRYLDDEDLEHRRALADELRTDRAQFDRLRARASERLARLPAGSKGVTGGVVSRKTLAWVAAGAGAAAVALAYRRHTRSGAS
jgi:hypothetical protein